MILQALTDYYQTLADRGEIVLPGWSKVKVSYALSIKDDGVLEQVIPLFAEQSKGKKTVLAPRLFTLPAPVKRSSGVIANFLCDNSSYMLGIDNKGKPQRSVACFTACKKFHETLLDGIDSPAAKAVLAFFHTWQPEQAAVAPVLAENMEEILAGANLIFQYDGCFIHEDPLIRRAWNAYYQTSGDGPDMICLVTGQKGPVESIHPAIKNVFGAQSSGAALVSFNAPAFCSYGKEQNLNAPTSKAAAFAYTAALNSLLADRAHTFLVGDATVVFWAKSGETAYQDFFGGAFGDVYEEKDLQGMVKELCRGHEVKFDEIMLDPNMEFYILGLSPNAARLSVRFFLRNTFGGFLTHIQAHRERMRIVRPAYEKFEVPSLRVLLDATVNLKSRDKQASPEMAGELLRAILNDTPYPATLLNSVVLRIRAEHAVTWPRAAILKADYLKKPHYEIPEKEVLTVSLNEASTSTPYNLGRLFSVLEAIQQSANPGINATIKDKYFNSASATPAVVFPVLINLAQKHLKKLTEGQRIYFEKQLQTILNMLGEGFLNRLNLPQQGAFQLGYYHQTQARYQKKEEN